MNIACLQLAPVWQDKSATHRAVAACLDATPLQPGTLLLLPEMFATGFSMNVPAIVEDDSGPTHQFLAQQARSRGIYILGGVVTRAPDGRGRNQAVLFSPEGKEVLRYTKIHPFSPSGEADHYQPGRDLVTLDLGGFIICPLICYDLRFPELFRTAALHQKASLFLVIAAWPLPRDAHWTTLLAARAIENQAYVAAVNQCIKDPRYTYPGKSRILDPQGNPLATAGADPALIQATLDPAVVATWRNAFPALKDARPLPL